MENVRKPSRTGRNRKLLRQVCPQVCLKLEAQSGPTGRQVCPGHTLVPFVSVVGVEATLLPSQWFRADFIFVASNLNKKRISPLQFFKQKPQVGSYMISLVMCPPMNKFWGPGGMEWADRHMSTLRGMKIWSLFNHMT